MGSSQAQERLYHLQGEVAANDAGSVSSDQTGNSTFETASGSPIKRAGSGKPDPEAKPFVPAISAGSQVGSRSQRSEVSQT